MTDKLDPNDRTVATFKSPKTIKSYNLSPKRLEYLREGRQPPLNLPSEVGESTRIGTVMISSEWCHDKQEGRVTLAGDPGSALVLLGTVSNEEDLVDLFDEVCELFDRMSVKGILTLNTF